MATTRPRELQNFADALAAALLEERGNFAGRPIAEKIVADMRADTGAIDFNGGTSLPVLDHLEAAFDSGRQMPGALERLADAFAALSPNLPWRRTGSARPEDRDFWDGHANVAIIGKGGVEDRPGFWIGASLVAPGIIYPDHSHSPEEVYLLISPGSFKHGGSGWTELAAGDTFHNVPGITHAMRAGAAPLLALWLLWPH
ncbi:MAG: transcriptional regulator [Rhizobiaceae bacterium]|nr:transcriptional regulator [Rhizobiaceae bacterium]